MDLTVFLDRFPEPWVLAAGGLVVGAMFGAFAQQSRFCLRAAVLDFAHWTNGIRLPVWLLCFGAALLATRLLVTLTDTSLAEARQLASPQSVSGAVVGGLMLGSGMVLARGCPSRLLVLSATGNLRALLSGLVFAVVAQASLHGILKPAREALASGLTSADVGGNDILALLGVGEAEAIAFACLWLGAGIVFAVRSRGPAWVAVTAAVAGLAIPLGWWFTATMATQAFDPVPTESVTFTGPSADTLMLFLQEGRVPDFGIGIVPGVFLGSFLAAAVTRELKLEGFHDGRSMRRYLVGAALMGFGGMLAGGCAVGAGVTGASLFALTSWLTLFAIWLAAALTDAVVDRRPAPAAASGQGVRLAP